MKAYRRSASAPSSALAIMLLRIGSFVRHAPAVSAPRARPDNESDSAPTRAAPESLTNARMMKLLVDFGTAATVSRGGPAIASAWRKVTPMAARRRAAATSAGNRGASCGRRRRVTPRVAAAIVNARPRSGRRSRFGPADQGRKTWATPREVTKGRSGFARRAGDGVGLGESSFACPASEPLAASLESRPESRSGADESRSSVRPTAPSAGGSFNASSNRGSPKLCRCPARLRRPRRPRRETSARSRACCPSCVPTAAGSCSRCCSSCSPRRAPWSFRWRCAA